MQTPQKRGPWFWYATFFGSGLFPKAPGTMGTIASLLLWIPVVVFNVPWWARALLVFVIYVTGTVAAQKAAVILENEDPKEVVIDEVAGQGLTFLLLPGALTPWWVFALGFGLFRFFDIVKPWPVSWADQKIHGGHGIMLDDMIAGLYALALLSAGAYFWPDIFGALAL